MKTSPLLILLAGAAFALAACKPMEEGAPADANRPFAFPGSKGRYLGVGIYMPGEGWSRMAGAGQPVQITQPADPATPLVATPADDDQVIVVVDSATGEIRQCGSLSGYCIRMNPWDKPLAADRTAPITLTSPPTPVRP